MHGPIAKIHSAKITFFELPFAKICSAKICARKYYAPKVFAVSNEYTLNLQDFSIFTTYTFVCLKVTFLFCPGGKEHRWGMGK